MNMQGKTILFICSRFFNYYKLIMHALEERGFCVDYFSDVTTSNIKILLSETNKNLFDKYQLQFWERNLSKMKCNYDYIFIIKGNKIPIVILDKMKDRYKDSPFIQYHWDDIDIKSNENIKSTFKYFDRILTYNILDADRYGFILRPFFYIYRENKLINKNIDILWVASYNTTRDEFLDKFLYMNDWSGRKLKMHYYINPLIYFQEKLSGRKMEMLSRYSFLKLDYYNMIKLLSKSKACIDIPYAPQQGLTTRAFESMSLQTKVITSNKNIMRYDFYCPENNNVIDLNNPIIDKEWLDEPYKKLDEAILSKYCISSWINDIFNL